jgi:hypothetical protein
MIGATWPDLPIEPVWKFYPQLTWKVIVKHARVAASAAQTTG